MIPRAPGAAPARVARALLVDYGGVLTTSIVGSFKAFSRAEGLPAETFPALFADEGARAEIHGLETGRLSEPEFERRFAARLGVGPEQLLERLFADLEPEPAMIEAVRAARAAGTVTCLVSNSWGMKIYDRVSLDGVFDALVISAEVGLRKPDPEIFLLAVERLGVAPEDCVFVDDLRWNCETATELGMAAVLHRDGWQTIAELERLLGLPLRARVREG